jgi:hypothetical protein
MWWASLRGSLNFWPPHGEKFCFEQAHQKETLVPHCGRAKVKKVMGEFKRRKLRSSSGARVSKRKQAVAIALSEAGLSRRRKRRG